MTSRVEAVKARVRSIKSIEKRVEKLESKISELKTQKAKLQEEGVAFMRKENLKQIKDGKRTISIKEMEVPQITNFMKIWKYAKSKNAPELFQRRVSSKAWREHGMKVPGIKTFTKRSLSIRTNNG